MTSTDKPNHTVIIALGTNIDHNWNMTKAMNLIRRIIGNAKCSRRMWTEPIGIASGMFLNMLVSGSCRLSRQELKMEIKSMERECGRTAEEQHNGIVRIDIDILKYDNETEHADDWNREYIKELINEL